MSSPLYEFLESFTTWSGRKQRRKGRKDKGRKSGCRILLLGARRQEDLRLIQLQQSSRRRQQVDCTDWVSFWPVDCHHHPPPTYYYMQTCHHVGGGAWHAPPAPAPPLCCCKAAIVALKPSKQASIDLQTRTVNTWAPFSSAVLVTEDDQRRGRRRHINPTGDDHNTNQP